MSDTTGRSPSSAPVYTSKLRLPATCEPPSETNPPKQSVWIIFGATGHMGRSLARAALSHGDQVVAVGRALENSIDQMQGWHENCLGLLCDIRVRETVDAVLQRAIKHFGRIDIIANCTGYGVIGACEDQDEHELRSQFETNFMGTVNILQLSLPYFRERLTGRYLIFSSTSGALGVPGLGPYCATKYAVEGLIESMLYEIDAFNIKATLIEPGHMRLDDPEGDAEMETSPGRPSSQQTVVNGTAPKASPSQPASLSPAPIAPLPSYRKLRRYNHFFVKPSSEPYSGPNAPAGHAARMLQWLNDRQPTSAVKSAELVWQLGHCSYPPLRLLLGSYAVESIRDRLRSIIEEIEDWKHLSFPVAADDDDTRMGGDKDEQDGHDGKGDDVEDGEGELE